jgi:hypothetical protein
MAAVIRALIIAAIGSGKFCARANRLGPSPLISLRFCAGA